MKKIVKLTESDLMRIIKKVVNEASCPPIKAPKLNVNVGTTPAKHSGCRTGEVPCGPLCCPQNNQCVDGAYCQHNTTCEWSYPHAPSNPY